MKLIAETAWHHEGDFLFMKNLINEITSKTSADIIKMHITLNFDEYMDSSHKLYKKLKSMIFNNYQWKELISIAREGNKEIMLLLNDTNAIEFGLSLNPEYVEIHSVCLNDLFMLEKLKKNIQKETKIVLGVGGSSIQEIENAIKFLNHSNIILMFGFQNYPTIYEDVNLNKIKKIMKFFPKFEYGYADHTSWNNENNELITLLGAASGMKYIEKHVTTHYGENRIDWSAAISIKMFNDLSNKIKILKELNGSGLIDMNESEKKYSIFGPMKKAAILNQNIKKGDLFLKDMIKFSRTNEISDMSQLDVIQSFGKKISRDLKEGTVLKIKHFS
ncbi:N-acetylneuraminate synthase family protein [Candidatus Pelagibacter sp. HIMB1623]|uniref:N-acetylneuraminate synthase family protein n=1 Tax=Candidatus Pelagibacter sp. HIMB1623 TaxID=3413358 RepID=UPI003F872F0C